MPRPVSRPKRRFIEVEYQKENARVTVSNKEVAQVQRQRFRFAIDGEFLRSCIPYGAIASAIGATVYFLGDSLSALVTSIAPGSAIFEVITDELDEEFRHEVEDGKIKKILDEAFNDIENSITKVSGKRVEWKEDISDEELSKLKKMRISNVKLCSVVDVDIAMQKLETELDKKATANEPNHEGPSRYRLWNSDLRSLLDKVFRESLAEETVLRFLLKCNELGITEEKDFNSLSNEEISSKFDAVLRVVELRKFMSYHTARVEQPTREADERMC